MIFQDKQHMIDFMEYLTKEYKDNLEEGMFDFRIEVRPLHKNNVFAVLNVDKKWNEKSKPCIVTGGEGGQPNI